MIRLLHDLAGVTLGDIAFVAGLVFALLLPLCLVGWLLDVFFPFWNWKDSNHTDSWGG